MSISQMGVEKLDMLTLEIPPFITETQLAMALYHIKVNSQSINDVQSEISNGRINYFTIGGTFPFTAEGFNPLSGVAKKDRDKVDMSKFSFSFIKLMQVCFCYYKNNQQIIKDVGLLDKLIGVEIPLNASEAEIATKSLLPSQLKQLEPFMTCSPTSDMSVTPSYSCIISLVIRCYEEM